MIQLRVLFCLLITSSLLLGCQANQNRQLQENQTLTNKPKAKAKKSAPPAHTGSTTPRSTLTLSAEWEGSEDLALVTDKGSLERADGSLALLKGTYIQVDVRRRATPPAQHLGHVSLILSDGSAVTLFPIWHKDAKRPETEVQTFEGKEVALVGIVDYEAPSDPAGGASPRDPCVSELRALSLAP